MGKKRVGALEKVDADLSVPELTSSTDALTDFFPGPTSSTKFEEIPSRFPDSSPMQSNTLTPYRSYSEDFLNQYGQYQSQRDIFLASPSTATSTGIVSFRDLIDFVAHVADCFPEDTAEFPEDLKTILTLHHATLESELREKIVGSLVLLRRKEIIDSAHLLNTLFPLSCCYA